mmetsp:Transcript_14438/g.48332  ORF Transcript_14438/g.48332 Transcript_14438/m.48332 type:complete len:87 (-) Transcript_14438:82-342(-)
MREATPHFPTRGQAARARATPAGAPDSFDSVFLLLLFVFDKVVFVVVVCVVVVGVVGETVRFLDGEASGSVAAAAGLAEPDARGKG